MNEVLLHFSFSEYWEFHVLLSTRICLHLCFYIVCPWLPLKAPFSYLTYKMVNHNIPRWNKWAAWLMYFRSNVLHMPFSFLQNTIGCQFLMMLTKYFRLTNYTWMFCEGYYLHRLLANTFEEERSLAFILSIGWGNNPVCIIVIRNLYVFTIFCRSSTDPLFAVWNTSNDVWQQNVLGFACIWCLRWMDLHGTRTSLYPCQFCILRQHL